LALPGRHQITIGSGERSRPDSFPRPPAVAGFTGKLALWESERTNLSRAGVSVRTEIRTARLILYQEVDSLPEIGRG